MKTKYKTYLISVIVLVLIFFAFGGAPFFVVNEYEQAIVTMFGKPRSNSKQAAGLYLKIPFFEKVIKFDKRILELDGDPDQIPTKEKRNIWVDTTARWKIVDPLKFFQSVYNERGAHARLDDIIDAAVRDLVSSYNLIEIVRSTNRELKIVNRDLSEASLDLTKGKEAIRADILVQAQKIVPQYGIELVDMRIKRLKYVDQVRQKVYERMISERKRAAERHRSEGRGEKAKIEGQTDKELRVILSTAYRDAQKLKGAADKDSAEIYAASYEKDPEFYAFMKSLDTYQDTITKNTKLILSTDDDYFKYLNAITPQ